MHAYPCTYNVYFWDEWNKVCVKYFPTYFHLIDFFLKRVIFACIVKVND